VFPCGMVSAVRGRIGYDDVSTTGATRPGRNISARVFAFRSFNIFPLIGKENRYGNEMFRRK